MLRPDWTRRLPSPTSDMEKVAWIGRLSGAGPGRCLNKPSAGTQTRTLPSLRSLLSLAATPAPPASMTVIEKGIRPQSSARDGVQRLAEAGNGQPPGMFEDFRRVARPGRTAAAGWPTAYSGYYRGADSHTVQASLSPASSLSASCLASPLAPFQVQTDFSLGPSHTPSQPQPWTSRCHLASLGAAPNLASRLFGIAVRFHMEPRWISPLTRVIFPLRGYVKCSLRASYSIFDFPCP